MSLALVAALAAGTWILRVAGPQLGVLPGWLQARLAGLAPALLAALVVTQLAQPLAPPRLDAKLAGVAAGGLLAVVRAPFVACVIGGAAAAALLRVFGVS